MPRSTISVPARNYTAGSRSVDFPNLAGDESGVSITLTRENWPDNGGADVAQAVFFGSSDGGATWFQLAGFRVKGGTVLGRDGQPLTVAVLTIGWPQELVNGVLTPVRPTDVRADVENYVSLRTAITISGF